MWMNQQGKEVSMPAFNYKVQFAPYIKDRSKFHTIRALRTNPAKTGDTLYHYTGMRNSRGEKAVRIIAPTPCTVACTLFFEQEDITLIDSVFTKEYVNAQHINDLISDIKIGAYRCRALSDTEKILMAWHDGFRTKEPAGIKNFEMMQQFFFRTHTPPFFINLFSWHPQPQFISYLNV